MMPDFYICKTFFHSFINPGLQGYALNDDAIFPCEGGALAGSHAAGDRMSEAAAWRNRY